ncbi:MAG: choice-of-anchor D domain-containing protein [Candidatus Kapabacteria bacterium]|nr:choice-of-anchor D domain-containing protein [Candidatus Kapabacteria bacterium]
MKKILKWLTLSIAIIAINKIFLHAQTQSDQSDSVWSIVAPLATSNDIDMKQCLVGKTKDSIITTFISNPSTFPIRIDTVFFVGNDAAFFKILNNSFPVFIAPGAILSAEFLFFPSSVGNNKSLIKIVTQTDTLIKNIIGEGIDQTLSVSATIINFDSVRVRTYKDSVCTAVIKNTGLSQVDFTGIEFRSYSGDFTLSSGSVDTVFTLKGGQSAAFTLRFAPKAVGRSSAMLALKYNGLGSPALVQLYGVGYAKSIQVNNVFTGNLRVKCSQTLTDSVEITNIDNLDINVLSGDIGGPDASSYGFAPAFSPFTLHPKETRILPITFKPTKGGLNTAYLDIKSNADPDSVYSFDFNIYNEEVSQQLNTTIIKFDSVGTNFSKDTTITLTNSGESAMSWKISATSNIDVKPSSIVLQVGEIGKINIHYKGSKFFGKIDEKVIITDNLCGRVSEVLINGKIDGRISALLAVGSAEGNPGTIINIPIKLMNAENILQSKATGISATLNFNSSILYPLDYPASTVKDGIRSILLSNLPLDSSELAKICFIVALGNAEETRMWLTDVKIIGDTFAIDTLNGIFKLTGICREGGTRLILTNDGQTGIISVSPNPGNDEIIIKCNLIEKCETRLSLYDLSGRMLKLIMNQDMKTFGEFNFNLSTKDIPNGEYIILLETQTLHQTEKVKIVR